MARGELAEVRVRGWDVSEPLTLAVNGERVRSRTQKTLAALVARTLDELDASVGADARTTASASSDSHGGGATGRDGRRRATAALRLARG